MKMTKISERFTVALEVYANNKGAKNFQEVLDDDLKMLVYDCYHAGKDDLSEELTLKTKKEGLFHKLFKSNK